MDRRKYIMFLVAATLMAVASTKAAAGSCDMPVATAQGQVSGIQEEGVCVWKGIPYAAPPLGELRWRATSSHMLPSGTTKLCIFGSLARVSSPSCSVSLRTSST